MDKLLLRPSEVAETLGFGRSKIYALLASGELPSVRVGTSVRIPVEGLRRWVAERACSAQEPPTQKRVGESL